LDGSDLTKAYTSAAVQHGRDLVNVGVVFDDEWLPGEQITFRLVDAKPPEKNVHSENLAAAGAAVVSENAPIDVDLQAIIEQWADLPDAMKAGIMAMVRVRQSGE